MHSNNFSILICKWQERDFFFSWLFLIFFNQLQYYIILYLSNSPTCVSVGKYVDMHYWVKHVNRRTTLVRLWGLYSLCFISCTARLGQLEHMRENMRTTIMNIPELSTGGVTTRSCCMLVSKSRDATSCSRFCWYSHRYQALTLTKKENDAKQ